MTDHKAVDENEAVKALGRLGLTEYEAKVFIALQRLGVSSARDIAQVVDVPRPQVYTTAQSLNERGLIDIQQSTPIQYRAIEIEEAKTKLRNRFERTQEIAFEYIQSVCTERPENEQQENVWIVTDRETVDSRITHLVGKAEQEILFGVSSASLLRESTIDTIYQAAANGVSVTVVSWDSAICDRFKNMDEIDAVEPAIKEPEETTGRLLAIDNDAVLLSVLGEGESDTPSETAIWSSETGFAQVLVRLIKSYLQP